ncbi:MAG: D-alanyl-D-alanine carboxypeptidase [Clostridia bacterium]|nr:D-alanyl-D-alanine carboxypeptidase [Clostridia bacterium]
MLKKLLAMIFCVTIIIMPLAVPVCAYEPVGVDITAESYLFASLDTDEVLCEKNANKKIYPASITKIMTVMLMLESEKYDPSGKVTMTKEVLDLISGTESSVANLRVGEVVSQLDLVYLVLMSSFGDAAYLASIYYGGSVENFVAMMNEKAKKLGMKDTNYVNPVGLHDARHYTTANDTLIITKYALQNETFKKVCGSSRYQMPATNMSRARTLSTTVFLQDTTTNYFYSYASGVKTGYTDEAGRCLVSTASYDGYNYICILFKCPVDPYKRHEFVDSKALYKWAFNNFEYKQVADTKNPVCEAKVNYSNDTDAIPLYIEKNLMTVLPKNADNSTVSVIPHLDKKSFDAPIKKGQKMGTADIKYAGKKVGTVELVAGQNVKRSNFIYVFVLIKNFLLSKYMMFVYAVIGVLIILFFVAVIRLNKGRRKKRKVRYIPYNDRNNRR